jgi:hypothetical protein
MYLHVCIRILNRSHAQEREWEQQMEAKHAHVLDTERFLLAEQDRLRILRSEMDDDYNRQTVEVCYIYIYIYIYIGIR